MRYQTDISLKTLRAEIRHYDRARFQLNGVVDEEIQAAKALEVCAQGFRTLNPAKHQVAGKTVFEIKDLPHLLVLRKLGANLRTATRSQQGDREVAVQRLRALMSEGVYLDVHKLDVKSFYESIDLDALIAKISEDPRIPQRTISLVIDFLNFFRRSGYHGVPRGIGISAALAEYVMEGFDNSMSKQGGVHFYNRYVDDVIVLSHIELKADTVERIAQNYLFDGLILNKRKFVPINMPFEREKPGKEKTYVLNYLGYRISTTAIKPIDARHQRVVDVDLADNKSDRVKTRIVRSFLQYGRDTNWPDLVDRIKLLSCCYNIFDKQKGVKRNAGLYCNYRFIDDPHSGSIRKIDEFYSRLILGKGCRTARRISANLSKRQKRVLMRYSFQANFSNKKFFHFSPKRIAELRSCWNYG